MHPPVEVNGLRFVSVRMPQSRPLLERLRRELDPGEADAIALAVELRAQAILIDERAGRAVAAREGPVPVGALSILLAGKRRGSIAALRPLMDRLQSELNFFISPRLYEQMCRSAGESTT
jgi:predicted nucleic acid-binding protein